jgi:hypothetical protein
MAHSARSEDRSNSSSTSNSSPGREAALAVLTGGVYGMSHTLSGHPLDTVKSKMVIQEGFRGNVTVGSWLSY